MPLVLVCASCGRSEVPIRSFELTFRGYLPDKPHSNRNMRRIKAGTADLCERCLEKLSDVTCRSFKEIDSFVIRPPRKYVRTKFSKKLETERESPN